eukprot:m.41855 g.41855  ORF g.41855 m.41855 type:complete len:530 (+) comp18934_c0_seq1:190-1779(+)
MDRGKPLNVDLERQNNAVDSLESTSARLIQRPKASTQVTPPPPTGAPGQWRDSDTAASPGLKKSASMKALEDAQVALSWPGFDRVLHLTLSNFNPGATVAFVSVPLSISLAVASAATPGMGTTTAIVGGLFGAMLGGSNYNIQGPTGALSPILAWYSVSYGQEVLPWLAIGAGIFSFIAWSLRIDQAVKHISISVMEGFNLGVGFTIAANQMPYGLGLEGLHKHRHLYNNLHEFASNISNAEPFQTSVTLIGFLMLRLLNRWRPKFPWFLCLACCAMIVGYLVEKEYEVFAGRVQSQSAMGTTRQHPDAFPLLLMNDRYPPLKEGLWKPPHISDLTAVEDPMALIYGSASVMILVVFETLISGKLADKKTGTLFDTRMEVLGVGFANVFCGMAGGFPCTAALARTNLNIMKGANSRTSGIISAIGVFILVYHFSWMFMYLPLPFVASMMLSVTFGMPDWALLREMLHSSKPDFALVIVVAVVCVMLDPGIGLLTGVCIEFLRRSEERAPELHHESMMPSTSSVSKYASH